ncbi:MAG: hypothetical protein CMJ34_14120 [Phycisphaerae bacterium]|nr:hypothetical protein [Phycisphaerae bacterium]
MLESPCIDRGRERYRGQGAHASSVETGKGPFEPRGEPGHESCGRRLSLQSIQVPVESFEVALRPSDRRQSKSGGDRSGGPLHHAARDVPASPAIEDLQSSHDVRVIRSHRIHVDEQTAEPIETHERDSSRSVPHPRGDLIDPLPSASFDASDEFDRPAGDQFADSVVGIEQHHLAGQGDEAVEVVRDLVVPSSGFRPRSIVGQGTSQHPHPRGDAAGCGGLQVGQSFDKIPGPSQSVEIIRRISCRLQSLPHRLVRIEAGVAHAVEILDDRPDLASMSVLDPPRRGLQPTIDGIRFQGAGFDHDLHDRGPVFEEIRATRRILDVPDDGADLHETLDVGSSSSGKGGEAFEVRRDPSRRFHLPGRPSVLGPGRSIARADHRSEGPVVLEGSSFHQLDHVSNRGQDQGQGLVQLRRGRGGTSSQFVKGDPVEGGEAFDRPSSLILGESSRRFTEELSGTIDSVHAPGQATDRVRESNRLECRHRGGLVITAAPGREFDDDSAQLVSREQRGRGFSLGSQPRGHPVRYLVQHPGPGEGDRRHPHPIGNDLLPVSDRGGSDEQADCRERGEDVRSLHEPASPPSRTSV